MRLLLTSSGFSSSHIRDFFISLLPKPPRECRVLFVAHVEDEEDRGYADETLRQLERLGFSDIVFFNLLDPVFSEEGDFDVIYMSGGSTYRILDRLRKTGAGDFVARAVRSGRTLYFGVSAGSIVAGPDIDIAGWGADGDVNDIGLEDLTGLRLTDFLLYPHYREEQKAEVEAYQAKTKFRVLPLADGEAVYVDDAGYRIVR